VNPLKRSSSNAREFRAFSKKQLELLRKINGIRKFALVPTRLNDMDGSVVWLEHYWSYREGLRDIHGTYHLVTATGVTRRFLSHSDKNIRLMDLTETKWGV
jgi:hypothetical protein